jgi:hypothetical protein
MQDLRDALISLLFLVLIVTPSVVLGQSADAIEELEKIDAAIHDAPQYPGRINPLRITTKAGLKAWATSIAYEEKEKNTEEGVEQFIVKWSEATASGVFVSRHCCTEVLISELTTTSTEWIFFGNIRVGDAVAHVLASLEPVAKREEDEIRYCGLHDCVVFTIRDERVSEVILLLYID